ncbi:MAG: flagellar hook-associated protein FlgK [Sedimentisphaerales bacterium]
MWNFDIGLTGLDAARKGLDVIGNNIANAATDGYHRQSVELTPAYARQDGAISIGGGVTVEGVKRLMDSFLELEILNQQSTLGQVSQESETLSSVESAFGELGSNTNDTGLNAAINKFFSALSDLSAHPDSAVYQDEVLSAGEEMAGKFRTLGNFLDNTESQIRLQSDTVVSQINTISSQIAELNGHIQDIEMGGSDANNLLDQRDQLINQLSQLVGIQTQQRDFGVVDVTIGGTPIVMGTTTTQLESGLGSNGLLGVGPTGANNYQTDIEGGQLGGLLTLSNTTISDIKSNLDSLARTIISQVNQCHCQGVGSDGSFTELTGWVMPDETLSDCVPPLNNGSFYIRVTDTATGQATRYEIEVNPQTDTLSTIASDISDNVPGLSASVAGGRLSIRASSGYKFDFLPAVLSSPTNVLIDSGSHLSATASGVYTGTENLTFTFTVVGTDAVGNDNLQLHVEAKDEDGNTVDIPVDTLNIGSGYAAGDQLDLGNGIKIAIGAGDLHAGDKFEVNAYASADTSGFLAATGLNAFFSGTNASNIAIAGNVSDSPGRIATSLGADMTDNTNALRLAALADTKSSDLGSLTPGDFYRRLVTDIGQQLSGKQSSKTNAENLMQNLTSQQSEISGVDMNEEAAQMLVYEQMFQAMAKYLATVQTTLTSLFNLTGSTTG